MKESLLASWNAGRIIKLLLGIFALIQWARTMENIMLFAGGFLLITAIINIGCGSSGCAVPQNRSSYKLKKEGHEEVDIK